MHAFNWSLAHLCILMHPSFRIHLDIHALNHMFGHSLCHVHQSWALIHSSHPTAYPLDSHWSLVSHPKAYPLVSHSALVSTYGLFTELERFDLRVLTQVPRMEIFWKGGMQTPDTAACMSVTGHVSLTDTFKSVHTKIGMDWSLLHFGRVRKKTESGNASWILSFRAWLLIRNFQQRICKRAYKAMAVQVLAIQTMPVGGFMDLCVCA